MGIRSYICIKKQFQNNFWDGIPYNKRANSHLLTFINATHNIIHEGNPLDNFESDHMREPSFSCNPPICNTQTAVCKGDIDDQFDFDNNDTTTKNDSDDDSYDKANSHAGDITMTPVEEFLQKNGDSLNNDKANSLAGNVTMTPAEEFLQDNGDSHFDNLNDSDDLTDHF